MAGSHYVNIRKQNLVKYQYTSGGGMTGGHYSETVTIYDDTRALISIEETEWYDADPVIREYIADKAILDELENVIRRYHMNFWDNKTFTDMFIADGESRSYSFDFDDSGISFSSQFYPAIYRKKLDKLDEIINKYIAAADKK